MHIYTSWSIYRAKGREIPWLYSAYLGCTLKIQHSYHWTLLPSTLLLKYIGLNISGAVVAKNGEAADAKFMTCAKIYVLQRLCSNSSDHVSSVGCFTLEYFGNFTIV